VPHTYTYTYIYKSTSTCFPHRQILLQARAEAPAAVACGVVMLRDDVDVGAVKQAGVHTLPPVDHEVVRVECLACVCVCRVCVCIFLGGDEEGGGGESWGVCVEVCVCRCVWLDLIMKGKWHFLDALTLMKAATARVHSVGAFSSLPVCCCGCGTVWLCVQRLAFKSDQTHITKEHRSIHGLVQYLNIYLSHTCAHTHTHLPREDGGIVAVAQPVDRVDARHHQLDHVLVCIAYINMCGM
jgi:hypothetical protein